MKFIKHLFDIYVAFFSYVSHCVVSVFKLMFIFYVYTVTKKIFTIYVSAITVPYKSLLIGTLRTDEYHLWLDVQICWKSFANLDSTEMEATIPPSRNPVSWSRQKCMHIFSIKICMHYEYIPSSYWNIIWQRDAIQILGQRTNQSYIKSIFTVSNCYTLSCYNCPNLDEYQKILENNIYVDFGLASAIERIPHTVTIPRMWFRFVSKTALNDFAENPPYLRGTNMNSLAHITCLFIDMLLCKLQTSLAYYQDSENARSVMGNPLLSWSLLMQG